MTSVRIAIAQLNVVVGDLEGNVERVISAIEAAEADDCDMVAFPELVISGYPPEDLLFKPAFVSDNIAALARVAAATRSTAALVGFVDTNSDGSELYNAAAICAQGKVRGTYHKRRLPNYAVFDEQRYFTNGSEPLHLYEIGGARVGVSICEDAWGPGGPVADLARGGADLIVNMNASPYHRGKVADREHMLSERAAEASASIVYVNLVGGQDELVFDGASVVVDPAGAVVARAPQYSESLMVVDLAVGRRVGGGTGTHLPVERISDEAESRSTAAPAPVTPLLDPLEEVYEALVLGTHDYVTKNGFSQVVLGLSGGVDSSLVAMIAVDAFGADRVHGVLMPSRYTSEGSITDSEVLARNLGIEHRTISIESAHVALLEMLEPSFHGHEIDLTEENLQPRIRGVLLMALSNKFGWMVLTTGNKSETSVGYATLYGDMAGGFAVIKDVPKLLVYELCRDRNARAGQEIIPDAVLTKPPSAELRPDQRDDQSLPPYEELDPILEAYVEHDRSSAELVAAGFDPELVSRIVHMVDLAEYKRRQSPPGPRITTKAFGKDRRLPITNRYR